MKIIMTFILVLSMGAPAFASSHAKKHQKSKHHSSRTTKHKKSHKQPQQVSNDRNKLPQKTTSTRAVASSGQGAGYVSKYFDKSVYTNTAAGK